MTPYEQAEALYRARPEMDFGEEMLAHAYGGYVLARPDCLAMIRPVCKDWQPVRLTNIYQTEPLETADCWFVWLLTGSLKEAVKHLPCKLPWVGFAQRGQPARFIELEKALAKIG